MIPVEPQTEPDEFNQLVRARGHNFLRSQGVAEGDGLAPRSRWKNRDYWRPEAIQMLHQAYNDICCYLCMYIENTADARRRHTGGSVEHVIPLCQDAWKGYEWTNYALAGQTVNSDRGDEPIISPFVLDFIPFELDLPSGIIFIAEGLNVEQKAIAVNIEEVLKFDERPLYERDRADYYNKYESGELNNEQIARYAPFIWYEIQRQDLVIDEH